MMGRSHAALGAVGYLALFPVQTLVNNVDESISIPQPVWFLTFFASLAAGLSLCTEIARPYEIMVPPDRGGGAMVVITIYRYLYNWLRNIFVPALFFVFLCCLVWILDRYAPSTLPEDAISRGVNMVVCAGFALLPDIDEPNSTVSRMFGPVSAGISRSLRAVGIKHRELTHSWELVVLAAILGLVAWQTPIAAGVVIVMGFIISGRMLMPIGRSIAFFPAAAVGLFVSIMSVTSDFPYASLALSVPLGVLLHDIGDMLTNSGVPFWHPYKKKYAAKLFSTNSAVEHWVVQPLLSVVLFIGLISIVITPLGQAISRGDMPSIGNVYEGINSSTSSE